VPVKKKKNGPIKNKRLNGESYMDGYTAPFIT